MTEVEILIDEELIIEKWRNYHHFQRDKIYKKYALVSIGLIFLLAIIFSLILEIELFFHLFLIGFVIITFAYIYYWIIWEFAFYRTRNAVLLRDKDEDSFIYKFDEEKIMTKSLNIYAEVRWEYIKFYEKNGNDIYIYQENYSIYDILSLDIIGENEFNEINEIVTRKIKKL